jgi:hypothetical protein
VIFSYITLVKIVTGMTSVEEKGFRTINSVGLPFRIPFINYPFNLKGNSKVNPTGKSESNVSKPWICLVTHALRQGS